MAPGPTRNSIHRRVKENVSPMNISTPRLRRRRSAMIPYMVWRDTVLLASQTRQNDSPKLLVVEEETTESTSPIAPVVVVDRRVDISAAPVLEAEIVAMLRPQAQVQPESQPPPPLAPAIVVECPADIPTGPDLEAEVAAPLQPPPQVQPESQPPPPPLPLSSPPTELPMASQDDNQTNTIELTMPCEAIVDDSDTLAFEMTVDSLEELEELKRNNCDNPSQLLVSHASGEYHPPVLLPEGPNEFRWGDYTLPLLDALGRKQLLDDRGRGRPPTTKEEIASWEEDVKKWLAKESPSVPRGQKLQHFITQLRTDVSSIVSLVDDGLSIIRSPPSLPSGTPRPSSPPNQNWIGQHNIENVEPVDGAEATSMTELDILLLQSTQMDLVTQIRDVARQLQSLTDQLSASETGPLQYTSNPDY